MKDPIVEEVRRAREQNGRKFDFDLKKIASHAGRRERAPERKIVSLPSRPGRNIGEGFAVFCRHARAGAGAAR